MNEIDFSLRYWILADETHARPHTVHTPVSEELIVFPNVEFAQRAAVQSGGITGEKLVPIEVSISSSEFTELLNRLRRNGINAIAFVRDGYPPIVVSVSSFVEFSSSRN